MALSLSHSDSSINNRPAQWEEDQRTKGEKEPEYCHDIAPKWTGGGLESSRSGEDLQEPIETLGVAEGLRLLAAVYDPGQYDRCWSLIRSLLEGLKTENNPKEIVDIHSKIRYNFTDIIFRTCCLAHLILGQFLKFEFVVKSEVLKVR